MRPPSITATCPVCHGIFHPLPSEVARGKGLFCSRVCADLGRVETLEQRFWRNVTKTDSCWLWTGLFGRGGYGKTWTSRKGGKILQAHRVSWEIHYGPIPDGLFVCHHCDVPPCVCPEHLFLGTPADNMNDKVAKSRQARWPQMAHRKTAHGERNGFAKITEEQVIQIRALYAASGMSQQALGDRFGIHQAHVSKIVLRKWWAHIA